MTILKFKVLQDLIINKTNFGNSILTHWILNNYYNLHFNYSDRIFCNKLEK